MRPRRRFLLPLRAQHQQEIKNAAGEGKGQIGRRTPYIKSDVPSPPGLRASDTKDVFEEEL